MRKVLNSFKWPVVPLIAQRVIRQRIIDYEFQDTRYAHHNVSSKRFVSLWRPNGSIRKPLWLFLMASAFADGVRTAWRMVVITDR